MGLGDLVQWLASTNKTGTLIIDGSEFTKKIFFRQGDVVAVASDNPNEVLGHYLIGWGFCSPEHIESMISIQDEKQMMLGELAVNQGFITTEELHSVVTTKTFETLYDLIMWDSGDFRFIESELPNRVIHEIPLPVTSFLFEGHRQRDERQQMMDLVPNTSVVPILIAPPENLNESEMALAMQMDGRGTIDDLALSNRCAAFDILKLVYRFVQSGLMQVHQSDSTPQLSDLLAAPWKAAERNILSRLERGRFLDALKLIHETLEEHGRDQAIEAWATSMSERIELALDEENLSKSDTLELGSQLDDLVNLDCDPAEGFVLSRITGLYTIEEVLRQLPGSELNNRIILHNLIRRGLVKVQGAISVKRFQRQAESK